MATIDSLPDDLLLRVFRHFAWCDDSSVDTSTRHTALSSDRVQLPNDGPTVRTLTALCVTCKRFRWLSSPSMRTTSCHLALRQFCVELLASVLQRSTEARAPLASYGSLHLEPCKSMPRFCAARTLLCTGNTLGIEE